MGRIKNTQIKRIAEKIMIDYGHRFSNDFYKNKEVVSELFEIESKKIRNMIAGYITHKIKGKNTLSS